MDTQSKGIDPALQDYAQQEGLQPKEGKMCPALAGKILVEFFGTMVALSLYEIAQIRK